MVHSRRAERSRLIQAESSMKIHRSLSVTTCTLLAAAGLARAQSFSEGFEGGAIPAAWLIHNQSQPGPGATTWEALTAVGGIIMPHSGAYLANCNFNSGTGTSTISNWLILPNVTLNNGDSLRFWTRSTDGLYPDRLQVRMSTAGASTNTGASATDVGDFSTLLLDINPLYAPTGYPLVYQQFIVNISGLPGPTSGRLAFRYFVENSGPNGARGDSIGLDDVEYSTAAESGACCLPEGSCIIISQAGCTAQGGIYRGNMTTCPANCPQPAMGACCLLDGTCALRNTFQCAAASGIYRGDNTACGVVSCPAVYLASNLNIPIPDGVGNGTAGADAVAQIDVPNAGTITDLDADFAITHTWQGDLRVRLRAPGGLTITLVDRAGVSPPKEGASIDYGFSTDNYGDATAGIPFVADDQATRGIYDDNNGAPGVGTASPVNNVSGRWRAVGSLATLNGTNQQGPWQLIVNDLAAQDTGTITQFSLHISTQTSAPCYADCNGDHALNVNDFVCFQSAFAAASPQADCNHDTLLNVNDFVCFQSAFAAGCSGL
jgi:subtilisin-like proprotein convertase family protein